MAFKWRSNGVQMAFKWYESALKPRQNGFNARQADCGVGVNSALYSAMGLWLTVPHT